MQLFVKYSDVVLASGALQWAANRAGEAKRQKGGERSKTKDHASLERSERRGFCFVGKGITVKDGTAPTVESDP